MASLLRRDVVDRRPPVRLEGEVECDEVYVIAGHKGRPGGIRGCKAWRNRLKADRGRGALATEKPPIFGMIQRGGEVRITMLDNVQQQTLAPLICTTIIAGGTAHTDEYNIYERLPQWGLGIRT